MYRIYAPPTGSIGNAKKRLLEGPSQFIGKKNGLMVKLCPQREIAYSSVTDRAQSPPPTPMQSTCV